MPKKDITNKSEFEFELRKLLNKMSMEKLSNTPDFILANYLRNCLDAFDSAIQQRDSWFNLDIDGLKSKLEERKTMGLCEQQMVEETMKVPEPTMLEFIEANKKDLEIIASFKCEYVVPCDKAKKRAVCNSCFARRFAEGCRQSPLP